MANANKTIVDFEKFFICLLDLPFFSIAMKIFRLKFKMLQRKYKRFYYKSKNNKSPKIIYNIYLNINTKQLSKNNLKKQKRLSR